jgi:hypothetical protein
MAIIPITNLLIMKKHISLLLFLMIGSVVLMASYRHKGERLTMINDLTTHAWNYVQSESLHNHSASVVNEVYTNSSYVFKKENIYEGSFFEKRIAGTWELTEEDKLVLNKGTHAEEIYEILELTPEVLKIRATERGELVTITYVNSSY